MTTIQYPLTPSAIGVQSGTGPGISADIEIETPTHLVLVHADTTCIGALPA